MRTQAFPMSVSTPASVKITLREFDFVLPLPPPVPAQDCQCHNSSSTHLKAHFKTINLTLEEVLFVPESLPRYLGIRGAAGWETVWMNIKIRVMNINKREQDFKLHVLFGH